MQDHPTLCGNCGATKLVLDLHNAIGVLSWAVVIDWRRDELCGPCVASFTWSVDDWHHSFTNRRHYVRHGALRPGTPVTSRGFAYDLDGVVEGHHVNPDGSRNGITRITCRKANGHRYSVDVGTVTLSPRQATS